MRRKAILPFSLLVVCTTQQYTSHQPDTSYLIFAAAVVECRRQALKTGWLSFLPPLAGEVVSWHLNVSSLASAF